MVLPVVPLPMAPFSATVNAHQMVEALPLIVWSANPAGEVTFANRHLHDYAGTSADDPAGSRWQAALHPDDLVPCLEAWKRSVEGGEAYDIEYRMRRITDGAYRWFRVRALPSRDPAGRIQQWWGTALDIHDLKLAEERATRMATSLTETLESITDAFMILDRDWKFTFVNREAESLLQRPREALLGRHAWTEFSESAGSIFQTEFQRAVTENQTIIFEAVFEPLGRLFAVRAYPSTQGVAVYFRDVTALRADSERLREQATLLDQAQDAIIVRGLDHTLRFWNKGAERIYGWTAEEAVGRSIRDLLYQDPSDFLRATAITVEKGEWLGEIIQHRRDGRALTMECRWSLVRDEKGDPKALLAINTDITERKKLEAQFLRAQRLESIGTLAGGIAHDLNNVLAPILLAADLLRADLTPTQREEIIDTIETSAKRGADMVRQVLSFARGVEGRQVTVEIPTLFRDLLKIVQDTLPKGIRVTTSVPEDLWQVTGDPTQLHQVLLNLCVNARDAMPEGGELWLTAANRHLDEAFAAVESGARPGPHVMIEVEDTGCGIPPGIIDQIFDPFFTTKEVGKGTGLGLSTTLGIVKSHGGFIRAYSEPGHGTQFSLYLPANLGRVSRAEPVVADLPRGRAELILVVDDEASVRQITRQTLETYGYQVALARDGAEAVCYFAEHRERVHLVLTDMMMPVMDGATAIQALKTMKPEVRVVATSGLSANGRVTQSAEAGAHTFLPKPFTAEMLLRTIRGVLDEEG